MLATSQDVCELPWRQQYVLHCMRGTDSCKTLDRLSGVQALPHGHFFAKGGNVRARVAGCLTAHLADLLWAQASVFEQA